MLDKLQSQFESGRTFTRSDLHYVVDRSHFPKAFWNLYPMNQDYYHELNPFFVSTLYTEQLLGSAEVYTCRDGLYDFGTFLLKNQTFIRKNPFLFLIPEGFECLIPDGMKDKFATWQISQSRSVTPADADRVILFGLLCEDYSGNLEYLEKRLLKLTKDLKTKSVDVVLGSRNNFVYQSDENEVYALQATSLIAKIFKDYNIRFISLGDYLKLTHLRNAYVYDLKIDNFFVSDSFQNFLAASKGATINLFSTQKPQDSVFDMRLSFFHTLHVTPMKSDGKLFADLLLLKKLGNNGGIYDRLRTYQRALNKSRFS